MENRVLIDIQDHVAHVRLNRPDKMNALDDAMFAAIVDAGEQLKANKDIRAVVLSGEGRAFCAGLDMGNFANMASGKPDDATAKSQTATDAGGRLEHRTHGLANRAQYTSWVWRELPVPVIAALHGVAFGGGCQISIGADMRYAAPGTKICIMEMRWGLVPDMGATPYLPHLLRDDVLRELTYTNRIIEADEAQALGLVTRVVINPIEAALQTAAEIASRNPEAVRAAKRILNNAPFQTPQEILLAESREQDQIIGKPNQVEAVMANMEKRAPHFQS
ncbi:crotonase/enoyl-CoA hydratase family protein [Pseudomonadales bacterium]|nr:crotonase/enoyl-CoA hydratase family protein [Pseudomonadales bacterium]MDC1368512.1 crotonase/enoyl-CoA hydratase family protein [Pseudomonadales bacterium]